LPRLRERAKRSSPVEDPVDELEARLDQAAEAWLQREERLR
jgi:hypothetical protein